VNHKATATCTNGHTVEWGSCKGQVKKLFGGTRECEVSVSLRNAVRPPAANRVTSSRISQAGNPYRRPHRSRSCG